MTTPLPLLRDFSDRLSPMVVKEMRQGLRTRFFTAALILFHVLLGLLMLAMLFSPTARDIHEMFWLVIIVTLLAALPVRGFNALNAEAKDGTLDMLVLTGMTSFRIVWGKWVSLYSQTLLVACSLLPYMIARYQLGGVELMRELLGMVILLFGSAIFTAALVGFSSQQQLLIRLLLAAGVGLVAFGIGTYTFVMMMESLGEELVDALVPKQALDAMLLLIGVSGIVAYLVYELLCIGSARLAMVKDSQGRTKRVVASSVIIFITASVWWMLWMSPSYTQATMAIMFVVSLGLLLLVGMDVLSESSQAVPMLASESGAQRRKQGVFRWLLQPGWSSGVIFYLLLCLFPISAIVAIELRGPSGFKQVDPWCWAACLMIANLVPTCVPIFRKDSRLAQWILVQLMMVTIGILQVIAMSSLPYEERSDWAYFGMITPISTLFASAWAPYSDREALLLTGSFVSTLWIIAAVLQARWENRRVRASQPPSHYS